MTIMSPKNCHTFVVTASFISLLLSSVCIAQFEDDVEEPEPSIHPRKIDKDSFLDTINEPSIGTMVMCVNPKTPIHMPSNPRLSSLGSTPRGVATASEW